MTKLDSRYHTVAIPIDIIRELDVYKEKNQHLGFTTYAEIVRHALREFVDYHKGNGGAYSTTTHRKPISPHEKNGEKDQT